MLFHENENKEYIDITVIKMALTYTTDTSVKKKREQGV